MEPPLTPDLLILFAVMLSSCIQLDKDANFYEIHPFSFSFFLNLIRDHLVHVNFQVWRIRTDDSYIRRYIFMSIPRYRHKCEDLSLSNSLLMKVIS